MNASSCRKDRTAIIPGDWIVWLCLLAAGCAGSQRLVQRGDELAEAGLVEEALEAYQQAAREGPDNAEIAARIVHVSQRLAAAANQDGLYQLESGDAYAAVLAFKRAVILDPRDPAYEENLKKAARQRIADGDRAADEKRYDDAISIFEDLIAELPRLQRAKRGLRQAQQALGRALLDQALEHRRRGLYANALIALVKLHKSYGALGNSTELESEVRKRLKQEAIFAFEVRPRRVKRHLVAGTARMVQRLQRTSVPGCDSAGRKGAGRPRVSLSIALQGVSFDSQRSVTRGTQKYQSGTRPVDNPAFVDLEKQIEQIRERIAELAERIGQDQRALEQAREAFADAGPDEDEAALRQRLKQVYDDLEAHRRESTTKQDLLLAQRNRLSRTPRVLDEPVYDVREYEIFEVTRTASARFVVDATSDDGQVLIRSATFEGSGSTKDTTNRAQRRYGIRADPLEFPKSDDELTAEAIDATVEEVAARIGQLCRRWQGEVLERARQARPAAQLEAIEDYVLFLFLSPEPPPPDLVQTLRVSGGLEDIAALRGAPDGASADR